MATTTQRRAALVLTIALALAAAGAYALRPPILEPRPRLLTLRNVTIANPGMAPLTDQTLIARDGRVESIAPSSPALDADVRRFPDESDREFALRLAQAQQYAGAWVLPGLVEASPHYPPAWTGLRAYYDLVFLAFGVTGVEAEGEVDPTTRAGPRLLPPARPAAADVVPLADDFDFLAPPLLWPLLSPPGRPLAAPGKAAWLRLARDEAVAGAAAAWSTATAGATLRPGAPADLIVLRQNPLDGGNAHASLELVVVDGRAYPRRSIDEAVYAYHDWFARPLVRLLARIAGALRRE